MHKLGRTFSLFKMISTDYELKDYQIVELNFYFLRKQA